MTGELFLAGLQYTARNLARERELYAALTQPRTRTKPRLRRTFNVQDARYEWVCSDTTSYSYGWGQKPEQAYELWLRNFASWRRRQPE